MPKNGAKKTGLARKSLKNEKNTKRERESGNYCRKWEVSCQNGKEWNLCFMYMWLPKPNYS